MSRSDAYIQVDCDKCGMSIAEVGLHIRGGGYVISDNETLIEIHDSGGEVRDGQDICESCLEDEREKRKCKR